MPTVLYVALGGALGSVARYLLSGWAQTLSKSVSFPFGTLTVNVLGCFIIGFLAALSESRGLFASEARAFVFVGLLGGFTTFSSFGNETFNLARESLFGAALGNIAANVMVGLAAVWLGRAAAHLLWR